MKNIVQITLRGLLIVIKGLWMVSKTIFFILFPEEPGHGPSYYSKSPQEHKEYLPGFHARSVIRAWHTWRPPLAGQPLPVED